MLRYCSRDRLKRAHLLPLAWRKKRRAVNCRPCSALFAHTTQCSGRPIAKLLSVHVTSGMFAGAHGVPHHCTASNSGTSQQTASGGRTSYSTAMYTLPAGRPGPASGRYARLSTGLKMAPAATVEQQQASRTQSTWCSCSIMRQVQEGRRGVLLPLLPLPAGRDMSPMCIFS